MNTGKNRIQKGTGIYRCTCCGRLTRSVGNGDCEHIRMCVECYEVAGIENQIQDGNFDGDAGRQKLVSEIRQYADSVAKQGGILDSEYLS